LPVFPDKKLATFRFVSAVASFEITRPFAGGMFNANENQRAEMILLNYTEHQPSFVAVM
jgi:hypothetical protein